MGVKKENKKLFKGFGESWKTVKDIAVDSKDYKLQKIKFDNSLKENEKYFDKQLTEKEIETIGVDKAQLGKQFVDLTSSRKRRLEARHNTTITENIDDVKYNMK